MERAVCSVVLLALTCGLSSARAQVLYGTIVGTVEDPSRAVITGATVTATNAGTGQSRETLTRTVGDYSFSDLLAGEYVVKFSAPGFRTLSRTGVTVSINTIRRVDVQMQVGDVTDSVTVGAEAAPLQTDKADVHVELTSKEITQLPLSGYRNYQSLIDLVPGTTPARFTNTIDNEPARALVHNVNGASFSTNNQRLDGATNVFVWLPHHALYVPPAEAVETVNVVTNSFDAEQGLAGGAAVNVTTKSGTNKFHGVANAYHTNSVLGAKNFFFRDERAPKNILNTYGAVFGGPIKRDKLFFFLSWEGMRQRQNFSGLLTVPTADQRAGDFGQYGTRIYDPLTGKADGSERLEYPNRILPIARQSAIARKMQDLLPLPNQAGTTANYFSSTVMRFDRDMADVKINWNRSVKNTLFGKYSLMDAAAGTDFNLGKGGGVGFGAVAGSGDTLVQLATLGGTYLFSSTFLVDGTIGFTRLAQPVLMADYGTNFGLDVLGIPGTNGPDIRQSGMPWFSVSSYENFGNAVGWGPSWRHDNTWTYTSNASWIKGSHDIRFGEDIARQGMNHWQPEAGGGPRGRFTFTGGITSLAGGASPNQFNNWAAFLLGLPQTVGKSLQFYDPMSTREWLLGFYFRDRWQATRNLTVTLGLRWEYYPLMTRSHRGIERYDPETNKVLIGGLGQVPNNAGTTVSKRLFAPRVGLAYRIGQKGSIRAGYGISIDPYPTGRPMRAPFPAVVAQDFIGPNSFQPYNRIEQGIPLFTGPDISSGVIDLPLTATTTTLPKGLFNRGYVESFNFSLERQFPGSFVGEVAYVGTRNIRARTSININAAPPGGGLAGRPMFKAFGRSVNTSMHTPFRTGVYDSLQAGLDRRFKGGLLVKVAYTWSKAISYNDNSDSSLFFNDPSVLGRNRALAGFDRTHNLRVATVAELPFGGGKRWLNSGGVGRAMLGGWQVNATFSVYSGTPFTITSADTSLNAPGNSQTADQVKAEVEKFGGVGAESAFFDPLAFAPVTGVRFGNTGRNILRGPGVVNLDVGVFRTFRLTERKQLQFRVESFNFTNTPHFNNPGANASNLRLNPDGSVRSLGGFMAITSAADDQRQVRLGLRLEF